MSPKMKSLHKEKTNNEMMKSRTTKPSALVTSLGFEDPVTEISHALMCKIISTDKCCGLLKEE